MEKVGGLSQLYKEKEIEMITRIICGEGMMAFAIDEGKYIMATQLLPKTWWQQLEKKGK